MPLPSTIGQKYRVLGELGHGGMGVVYQVVQIQTGIQYALKVLSLHGTRNADTLSRFKREIKMPSRIDSPHIVRVIDSDMADDLDGAPYYVMELLRGCDLRRLLDKKYSFSHEEIIWLCQQITSCLDSAHKAGITHRDLKPDNIYLHLTPDGVLQAKILDFGIAHINQELLESQDRARLTATQAMLGTPLYMSPEQAMGGEGRKFIGPATDVWALGLIVFELLTGRSYWAAESLLQHLGQLMFAPLTAPSQRESGLPKGFDDWFTRSCARLANERFPSVSAQFAGLAPLLGGTFRPAVTERLTVEVGRAAPPLVNHAEPTVAEPLRLPRLAGDDEAPAAVDTVPLVLLSAEELTAESDSSPQPSSDRRPSGALPGQPGAAPPDAAHKVSGAVSAVPPPKGLPPRAPSSSQQKTLLSISPPAPEPSTPAERPGDTASPNLRPSLRPAWLAGATLCTLLGIGLLLGTRTGPSPAMKPQDMATPTHDLASVPDLAPHTVPATVPVAVPKREPKKSPLPPTAPPPKKDKPSLKYFVPPSL